MPSVWQQGDYFGTRYITGPQILLLLLDLQPERIADPDVTALDACPIYGPTPDEAVRAAVLDGTDRANAQFGTNLHPFDIRYSYSGWDTERCALASWAAYNIVQAVAAGTVAKPDER